MGCGLDRYAVFFSLLRKALVPEGDMPDVSGADWEFIFSTAGRHFVRALLYDAVKVLPPGSGISPVLAAGWLVSAKEAENNYKKISGVVDFQRGIWSSKGIDAVLLKGLCCSRFYPVPEHRTSGDIDWWMRGRADWDAALEWLTEEGLRWETDSDGDISYAYAGMVVEHHRKGLSGDGPEAELLFLADHVFHHAAVSGVGLRQVCDYAMARRYHGDIPLSGGGGWVRLLDAVAAIIMDPGVSLPSGLRRRAESFLALVMEDGNFGLDRKNRFGQFFRRAAVVGVTAPGKFIARWLGLGVGRMKRILYFCKFQYRY